MNLGRLEYWIYTSFSDDFIVKKVLSKIPPSLVFYIMIRFGLRIYGAKTIRLFKDCKHWFMEKLHEFLPHWPRGISDSSFLSAPVGDAENHMWEKRSTLVFIH